MTKNKFSFLLIIVCILQSLLVSCNNSSNKPQGENEIEDTAKVVISFPKNAELDNIGNLLAGIDKTDLKTVLEADSTTAIFWVDYCKAVDSAWNEITTDRLSKMDKWTETEIAPKINDTALLFYPFSGPDFLNAYHLFPNSNEYILIAMEKLGTIPDMNTMSAKQMRDYLESLNNSIRDVYKRSYFITGNMEQDLRKNQVNGVLPVLYLFLERTGHEIYDFGYYQLQNDGITFLPIDKPTNSLKVAECIKFKVLKKGDDKLKEVTYFYADISDAGFVKNPILLQYLQNMRECNTFIKSASYLNHYETFTNIRNLTLNKSNAVLQDDTGVPFRYFAKKWSYYLYGIYEKPIEDFKSGSKYLFQADLDEKYKTENPKALDFSLGYHWRYKTQNWVLYVKKTAEAKENDTIN